MPPSLPQPNPFFTIRAQRLDRLPTLCGLCVGYERGDWRAERLADHIFEWLPEFALSPAEWTSMQHANSVELMRRAARTVYTTDKFANRGEFGELFLHAAIRQVHNSLPAISKLYYKSAANDTVKGFDAVHVVGTPDEMELWLGEAKFYSAIREAIADVVASLKKAFETDYLRSEFILIANKIDDTWPHAEQLRRLLSPNTSLDEVFQRACIPVLLTYDSTCLAAHSACSADYVRAFEAEMCRNYDSFAQAIGKQQFPEEVRIHLFLLPLNTKDTLIGLLETKLKIWQQI